MIHFSIGSVKSCCYVAGKKEDEEIHVDEALIEI